MCAKLSGLDMNTYYFENKSFSIVIPLQKLLRGKEEPRKITIYYSYYGLDKGFMGTVQNRALKSLHEGSLEITLTIQSLKLRNTDCILEMSTIV